MEKNLKKNTIWNTLGITLNSFNSLFFLIIINRINGTDVAGIFSFGFSVSCLLYVVGIYSGRTFQISDVKNEFNDREYLLHKIFSCCAMMILSIIFIFARNYTLEKNLVIIFLCLYKCLEAFSDTLYGYLQKNFKLYIVGKSLFFKSLIGILVFFIVDAVTRNIILSSLMLVMVNLLFILFYDFRKSKNYISNTNADIKKAGKIFQCGFSVFAFSFLAVFIVNIPKYIIDFMLSNVYQTIFSIIVMPGTVMSLCGQYIIAPMLTKIVDCYNRENYKQFNSIIMKLVAILLSLGVIVEIAAALLGIPVLSFVYAIKLDSYRFDLLLIILGAIMYAIANIFSSSLIVMRKNNMQVIIYLIDSMFGLIVCYLLIASLGVHGATYGYFLTMMLHALLYTVYYFIELKKLTTSNK